MGEMEVPTSAANDHELVFAQVLDINEHQSVDRAT